MAKDNTHRIRFIGPNRDYADGAEDTILGILENAVDRTDGSDELQALMVDWPTTYHLSPGRANLVRPFTLRPEIRVLEIGAGTGAVTRYLGETGASVVALEGEVNRARAISLRCADLDNVEVVCGDLADFEDPTGFDLVIVIGVLEYAGGSDPDNDLHAGFLRQAVRHLNPNGALLLAIENQIGLKYLLGFSEDHLNEPWAGVAGYPGNPAVRTFSKSGLGQLLDRCGLPAGRWFYPFPDYKLPRVILTDEIYRHPHGVELAAQLVAHPVSDLANPPSLFCDDRASYRVFLEAGLGTEVANSFLVLATRTADTLDRFCSKNSIAWHFSSNRRRQWRRTQAVIREGDDFTVRSSRRPSTVNPAEESWLRQDSSKEDRLVFGRTFEQLAMEACRRSDTQELGRILQQWRENLLRHEITTDGSESVEHPFSPSADHPILPPDFLDASLSNFVVDGNEIVFIDREWQAGSGVDFDLVAYRALWYFALELVTSGASQSFGPDATTDEIALQLFELAGFRPRSDAIGRFIAAETRIQSLVTGKEERKTEAELTALASLTRITSAATSTLPVARIRRDTARLGEMLEELRDEAEQAVSYQQRLETEIDEATDYQQRLETEIDEATDYRQRLETEILGLKSAADDARTYQRRLETEIADRQSVIDGLTKENGRLAEEHRRLSAQVNSLLEKTEVLDSLTLEVENLRKWRESFEQKLPVRGWRRLQRLLS